MSLDVFDKSLALPSLTPHQICLHIANNWPEPSLLQTNPSQLSQSLLTCQMLQTLNHLRGPLVDVFQYVHVTLVWGSKGLDPALQICLTSAK